MKTRRESAILAVLTAISLVFSSCASREQAGNGEDDVEKAKERCSQNLKEIAVACLLSSDLPQQKGRFPQDFAELATLGKSFYKQGWFECPTARSHRDRSAAAIIQDYVYIPGSTVQQSNNIVAFCVHHGNGGRLVAYASGVVEWLTIEDFRKSLRETAKSVGIDFITTRESGTGSRRELTQLIRKELGTSSEGTKGTELPTDPPPAVPKQP